MLEQISDEIAPKEDKGISVSKNSILLTELVSSKPDFLIRFGLPVLSAVLLLIIGAAAFIEYPDLIYATARLTSINAPKPVVTQVSGKLVRLSVSENQSVVTGQVLGFIESTAKHDDVLALEATLRAFQQQVGDGHFDSYLKVPESELQLGELQGSYQTFIQSYTTFEDQLGQGYFKKRKRVLLSELANIQNQRELLSKQGALIERDVDISQQTFLANKTLKETNVISDFDFRAEQSRMISKELAIPQNRLSIASTLSLQNQKEREIMELDNTARQQASAFRQSLNSFISALSDWKKKYVLLAPLDGKVVFASFYQQNQQLRPGETICFINPDNSQYYAELHVPQSNFGKSRIGQRVLLKFKSYPHLEFGAVVGEIDFINRIPIDSGGYLAKVRLDNGLETTYRKKLQFRDGLVADAEIITNDLSLLQRFYYRTIGSVSRSQQ